MADPENACLTVELDVAAGAGNTTRPLTHPLDSTKEGLAMDATQRTEEWRAVPGYEDSYEVSNLGHVRSVTRTVIRRNGWPMPVAAKVLKVGINPRSGYPTIKLKGGMKPRCFTIHRLVARAFHGEPEPGQEVRHLDGNQLNSSADNLCWGTKSENNLDKLRHGTHHLANRTHCPRGHKLEAPNLRGDRDGGRRCLACNRAMGMRSHYAKTGRFIDWLAEADSQYERLMRAQPTKES